MDHRAGLGTAMRCSISRLPPAGMLAPAGAAFPIFLGPYQLLQRALTLEVFLSLALQQFFGCFAFPAQVFHGGVLPPHPVL